ncbi:MAG: NBR1-Ig-like domain-containing protein [Pelolinea sp.]|nr:NBR1-Ig-like domain-containing protein [Pelolinea sp.]
MPKKRFVVVLLTLAVVLSACNFPLAFDDPAEVENAVAETVAAYEAAEEVIVVPTLALLPTSTPMPTIAPTEEEEEVEAAATTAPCLSATAYDLTVPDNTKYAAGKGFDKAWTFKNVGYCTWSSDYKIVFVDGDQMNGPDSKKIGVEVKPNGEVDVVVVLTAPSTAGTYRGNWILQSADGVDFGPVWVKIIVE